MAYFVGRAAERHRLPIGERDVLADKYGCEHGKPTLTINDVAAGGSDADFAAGVRAWFEREKLAYDDQGGASYALNAALLERAKAKAEAAFSAHQGRPVAS